MKESTLLTPEQKWEQATIANNFIFYKVMRNNPDVCKELLEILLEIEIEKIQLHSEEEILVDYESKGIRLDVYVKNSTQVFDLEMQSTDTKELPERSRYYQGAIDVDELKSGQMYKELKDSYIIFICLEDIFNKGLPIYTFENLCRQNTSVSLCDRAFKYFFIAENCDKITNKEQKAFLKLLSENKGSGTFTNRIAALAEEAKHNTEWKRQYMEWERQLAYKFDAGKQEGITVGAQQKAIEAAKSFAANGVSEEIIAKSLNMTITQVQEILKGTVSA